MRSVRLINISQKVSFQLTPENAKLGHEDCLVANSSETPTTIAVQSIPRNDRLPLTGGPQMLTTDDFG